MRYAPLQEKMSSSTARRVVRPFLILAAALFAGSASSAQEGPPCPEEPILQNWTGAGTTAVPGFVAGEEWGAVFQAPAEHYPIEIQRVGFGWGSFGGGQPDSLEQSINVYAGALPNPGAPIFTLDGPVLSDGFINEFDISPGGVVIPGGQFTVTIELANNSTIFGPAPVHDGNGCQSPLNVISAIPGGWSNACSLGVSGDWLVHVIYRQVSCGGGGPINYCTPLPNTTGGPSFMSWVGATSVSANNFGLVASPVPAQRNGLFV